MSVEVLSIDELLSKDLRIPAYQRLYRWIPRNVSELLNDIDGAIRDSKAYSPYR